MTVMNQEGKALCPPSLHRLDHLQATLPAELLALETWLPWLALPRGNGKIGKVPALPRAGTLRPIDCRGAGLTLAEAHDLARRHGGAGIGVVLAPDTGLSVLDLDAPLTLAAQALLRDVAGLRGALAGRWRPCVAGRQPAAQSAAGGHRAARPRVRDRDRRGAEWAGPCAGHPGIRAGAAGRCAPRLAQGGGPHPGGP